MKRPQPLWRHWAALSRRLRDRRERRVALFSDFDGTLAPIVPHPDRARLPVRTRRALLRLAKLPTVTVALVSGRSLADLRRRVSLKSIHFIGSHGEEWTGARGRRRTRANARSVACIRELGRRLEKALASLPGIYVERKTVSVAIHYRRATPGEATEARRSVVEMAKPYRKQVRLLEGKKMVELLPAGSRSKGAAVARLRARWAPRRPLIYLGDDVTDETVFRRLRKGDIGIHVGDNSTTQAGYRVRSTRGAAQFLERLHEVLK
jgi:trehalose-phosphatase